MSKIDVSDGWWEVEYRLKSDPNGCPCWLNLYDEDEPTQFKTRAEAAAAAGKLLEDEDIHSVSVFQTRYLTPAEMKEHLSPDRA